MSSSDLLIHVWMSDHLIYEQDMITPTTYLIPFKIEPPGSTTPLNFSNLYMPIKRVLKKI
jgi:hypothetical protein